MVDWRDQEAANEGIFRDMNEWTLEASKDHLGADQSMSAFLCECSDRGCTEPINLTHLEYEAIRAVSIRFAIALHHENPEIDRVLWENPRYATVEKIGAGARVARASDPRR